MTHTYSSDFYAQQQEGSLRSARRVLPHLVELVGPRSIVDVGCGVGTWLAAARELGITDIAGIDGGYVDRRMLQIPEDRFFAHDLSRPFRLERTFDAALCLEVAEHLPESAAEPLVESIARLAPVVLFSAAIPRQGGEHHVNEQWQPWWAERFSRFGFVALDSIRQRVWHDRAVDWWYAQNMLLFVREDHLTGHPALATERARSTGMLSVVHPEGYLNSLAGADRLRPRGLREWVAAGPAIAAASLRRLLTRR